MLKMVLTALGLLAAVAPARRPATLPEIGTFDTEDVLARTYAAYAAYGSYADSGTVVEETTGFRDRFTFRTLHIHEPRPSAGGAASRLWASSAGGTPAVR